MAITINEIAKIAKVSRGTVDRVLNGRGGVKPEVALRIREIASALDYKPNRAGKALAARKKPIKVGCLLPIIDNPFFDDIIKGLLASEKELSDYGFSIELVQAKGYDVEKHLEGIQKLLEKRVDALCLTTVDVPAIIETVERVTAAGIPVATINSDVGAASRLFYVGSNYLEGGRTAAGMLSLMLKEKGTVLIVTGSLKMQGHNQRINGFRREIRKSQYGISVAGIVESEDDDERAYSLTKEALQRFPAVNSIYITSAGVAGICRAVEEMGLSKKLCLISFDDVPATRRAIRNGTINATICQEPFLQGSEAMRLMFNYFIEGTPPENRLIYTQNVIKIRQNLGDG